MTDAEVYAKAAKMMEDGHPTTSGSCCWAIQLAKDPDLTIGNSLRDEHCRAMKKLYAPRSDEAYWMGDTDREANEVRILALCFMAAITSRRR